MKERFLPYRKLLLVNAIIIFAFTGCASRQVKMTETGFLSSYEDMEVDEESKGMHVYINPDIDITEDYNKILIAPVQFKLDPLVKAHEMEDEDQEQLADYFIEKFEENLSENYEITDMPGADVLLFRMAVTDILPNKVYLNLHWSTTLTGAGTGGASLEAELVDSITSERVASFTDARKGKRLNYTKGLTKWGHTRSVLGIWASLIAEHLNDLKEVY